MEGHVRAQIAIITCLLAHAEGHVFAKTTITYLALALGLVLSV